MKPFLVLLLPLVLVGCGPQPPASQAEAVAAIKKLGGSVRLDQTSGEVVMLFLSRSYVTDAGLEHLQGITSLTTLWLQHTLVTDAGLEHLKGLTSLTKLYLGQTQITDAGLAKIKAALPNCKIRR